MVKRAGQNKEKAELRKQIHELEKEKKRLAHWYQDKLYDGVRNANYVCYSIIVLTLGEKGWKPEDYTWLAEGYSALVDEIAEMRSKPSEIVKWAEECSGMDIKGVLDNSFIDRMMEEKIESSAEKEE